MGVRGWNVSMPNKTAIIPYLDKITPAAEMCGAVNTVINDNGVLTGTITDGTGWVQSVREQGVDLTGKKMTLLGAGGAATAILVQAALDGLAEISVFNRKDDFWSRAEEKTAMVQEKTGCKVNLFSLDDKEALRAEIASSDLLANATGAGMKPHEDICLVDADMLRPGLVVTDCVYNPRVTLLLDRAEKAGCKAISGLGMMLYQGAEAFRLWTGEEMPVDYVREQLGL
jgi:shikimate dehydrogenase